MPITCGSTIALFHLKDNATFHVDVANCTEFVSTFKDPLCGDTRFTTNATIPFHTPLFNTTPTVTVNITSTFPMADTLTGVRVLGVVLQLERVDVNGTAITDMNGIFQLEDHKRATSFSVSRLEPSSPPSSPPPTTSTLTSSATRLFDVEGNVKSQRPNLQIEFAVPWRSNVSARDTSMNIRATVLLQFSQGVPQYLGISPEDVYFNASFDLRPQLPSPPHVTKPTPTRIEIFTDRVSTVAAVSGAFVSVGIAMQQGVAGAMSRMSRCERTDIANEEEEPLPLISHPLGFPIGSGGLMYSRGAVVSNLVVVPCLCVLLLVLVVGPLVSKFESIMDPQNDKSDNVLHRLGCPTIIALPYCVTAEGSAAAVTQLLLAGGPTNDWLIGSIGLILILATLLSTWGLMLVDTSSNLVCLRRTEYCGLKKGRLNAWLTSNGAGGLPPHEYEGFSSSAPPPSLMHRILNPWYEWVPRVRNLKGQLVNREFTLYAIERTPYFLGDRWFLWAELVLYLGSLIVGMAEGFIPFNDTVCEVRIWVAFIATLLQVILLYTTTLPVEFAISIGSGLLTALLGAFAVAQMYARRDEDDDEDSSVVGLQADALDQLQLLVAVFGLIGVVIGMGAWSFNTYHSVRARMADARPADTDDEDESQQRHNVFVNFIAALCGCCQEHEDEDEARLLAPTLPEEEVIQNPAWILKQLENDGTLGRDYRDNAIRCEVEIRRKRRAQEEWDRRVAESPLHNQPWLNYREPPPPQPPSLEIHTSKINSSSPPTPIRTSEAEEDVDKELDTLTFSSLSLSSPPSTEGVDEGSKEVDALKELFSTSSTITRSNSLFSDFTSQSEEDSWTMQSTSDDDESL